MLCWNECPPSMLWGFEYLFNSFRANVKKKKLKVFINNFITLLFFHFWVGITYVIAPYKIFALCFMFTCVVTHVMASYCMFSLYFMCLCGHICRGTHVKAKDCLLASVFSFFIVSPKDWILVFRLCMPSPQPEPRFLNVGHNPVWDRGAECRRQAKIRSEKKQWPK